MAGLLLALPLGAEAAVHRGNPSNYRTLLSRLQPGDVLELEAGRYTQGLPITNLHGRAGAPVVITGPASGSPAILLGRSGSHTISIRDSSYVTLRNLTLDQQGHAVSGVRAEGTARFAHNITLEGLTMSNFARNQQITGISTFCTTWDWTIRNNVIRDPGLGLYLGSSDGTAPFVRGTIEHNLIVNPIGYGMQIKNQVPRASVQGMPTTPSVTVIRHNVFEKSANASTGGDSRPNLLIGAFPPSGPGRDDRYEIYGNFFFQNSSRTQPLFYGEGHISFHDNVLVNTFGPGITIAPYGGAPRNIAIWDNTIYTNGAGIRLSGLASGFEQIVAGNAIFASTAISGGGTHRDNFTAPYGSAGQHLSNPGGALGSSLDLYPSAGALESSVMDRSAFAQHRDADRDFNGTLKNGRFRGAYSGSGANPGWRLARGSMAVLGASEPGGAPADAGTPSADAGTPSADAGTPSAEPAPDAAVPEVDGGVPEVDAAVPEADGGAAEAPGLLDAGESDAAVPPPPGEDPAPEPMDPALEEEGEVASCECVSPGRAPGTAAAALLGALVLTRTRRRRA